MRISGQLEKELLQVEESGADNLVHLLDLTQALEKVYQYINTSFIADEKDYAATLEGLWCCKERYDAINKKTIYQVGKEKTEDALFNIEVSNNGEISFEITGENKEEAEELINKVNAPSSKLLELVRMNADISFFTENKELVFSEKPYFAIRMGNFVEGDKAVLVYKEEGKDTDINKKNSGLRYIRVDQIEEYLKDIKIDERIIPVLTYAYLGEDYSDGLETEKKFIKGCTYPELTPEKVERYTNQKYKDEMTDAVLCFSFTGAIAFAIIGGVIGGATALPLIPCLIVGAVTPVATGTGIYLNKSQQIKLSKEKNALIANARLKTYSILKKVANENISYQAKEFAKKRAKKSKPLIIKGSEKHSSTEIIREVKSRLSSVDPSRRSFFDVTLAQILNAYTSTDNSSRDADLYEELSKLVNEFDNHTNTNLTDSVDMAIATIKRLSTKTDMNSSIKVLNSLMSSVKANRSYPNINNDYSKEVIRTYLELMLQASANSESLSVESIAAITSTTRLEILTYVKEFSKRVLFFDEHNKKMAANRLYHISLSDDPTEVRIIKAVKLINEEDLVYDLLGKEIKSKDEKPKVKAKVEQ